MFISSPRPRLYPTVKEEREMRELIEKYGFKNHCPTENSTAKGWK